MIIRVDFNTFGTVQKYTFGRQNLVITLTNKLNNQIFDAAASPYRNT